MRRFTLAISTLLIAAFACVDVPRDEDLAKLIVGKWKHIMDTPFAQVKGEAITEYKADGTFSASAQLIIRVERIRSSRAEGIWSVKGNLLTWTVKTTTDPDIMVVGETYKDEILEIDAKHIKYKDDEGEIEVETRMSENNEADKDGSNNKIKATK